MRTTIYVLPLGGRVSTVAIMTCKRILILLFITGFFRTPVDVSGALIVDSWELITFARRTSPTQTGGAVFEDVINPFHASHGGMVGNSSSTASYDFAWTGDEASFGVSVNHHLEQLQGETITSGRILIWPAVDSIVTFSGNWQYAWPVTALGTTNLYMSVIGPDGTLAENIAHGGNVGLGPPFGTFELSNNARLEVGNAYLLNYSVRVQHFDPTPPGTFGHGEGSLNFTITPVPEPATLALLVLSISIFKPRRRHP